MPAPTAVKHVPFNRVISHADWQKRVKGDIVSRESSAEDGLITVRFSNFTRDDYGTRFDPAGCDMSQYTRNPMVTYCHGMDQGIYSLPVGRGKVETFEAREDGLYMQLEFTPEEVFDFGAQVGRLVRSGFLNMVSIGADPIREEVVTEANGQQTLIFRQWKLYDISIVPMGSNDDALITKRAKQFSLGVTSLKNAEKQLREATEGITDDKVQEVADVLAPDAAVETPPAPEVPVVVEGEPVVKVEASALPDGTAEVIVEVPVGEERAYGGTDPKKKPKKKSEESQSIRIRQVIPIKETEDQITHREYFEKWHKTGKQYRSLLAKLYSRIGEKAPDNEKEAVERMSSLILPPEQQPSPVAQSQSAAARQLRSTDVELLASQLGAQLPQLMRAALAKVVSSGKPLRRREDVVAAAVEEVVKNISISIPSS